MQMEAMIGNDEIPLLNQLWIREFVPCVNLSRDFFCQAMASSMPMKSMAKLVNISNEPMKSLIHVRNTKPLSHEIAVLSVALVSPRPSRKNYWVDLPTACQCAYH